MIIICKQLLPQVALLNTNNLNTVTWFQVFLCNVNNFQTELFDRKIEHEQVLHL